MSTPKLVTRECIQYFRTTRQYLVSTDTPPTIKDLCKNILGCQAQLESAAILAICLRIHSKKNPCTFSPVQHCLHPSESMPSLVRCWGQRGTLHLYSTEDWYDIIQARRAWSRGTRTGLTPTEDVTKAALKVFEDANEPIPASELTSILPKEYIRRMKDHLHEKNLSDSFKAEPVARRRTIFKLSLRGDICHAHKNGSTQMYVSRKSWFPELSWPDEDTSTKDVDFETIDNGHDLAVHTPMVRRYFKHFGPATTRDVAHYFGSTLKTTRLWISHMMKNNELIVIKCKDRIIEGTVSTGTKDDLLILKEDEDSILNMKVPGEENNIDWPIRFLPLYDTTLMGYMDKSWMVPNIEDRKLVWKKAAYVSSICLYRGEAIATYTYTIQKTSSLLQLQILKLSKWNEDKHFKGLKKEADRLKDILECENVEINIE